MRPNDETCLRPVFYCSLSLQLPQSPCPISLGKETEFLTQPRIAFDPLMDFQPPIISISNLSLAVPIQLRIRLSLDMLDQGCLVSNIHRHTDRAAHIINAQRGDMREKADVVCLKNTV